MSRPIYLAEPREDSTVVHSITHGGTSFVVSSQAVAVSVVKFLTFATPMDIYLLHSHLLAAHRLAWNETIEERSECDHKWRDYRQPGGWQGAEGIRCRDCDQPAPPEVVHSMIGDEPPYVRPSLVELGGEPWMGDDLAQLIYDTLCDRGLEPEEAAKRMNAHYDYDPFGRLMDDIQDTPVEDWEAPKHAPEKPWPTAEDRPDIKESLYEAQSGLEDIQKILDGRSWGADELDAIAEVLRSRGLVIAPPPA